jgi:hypothetical protein
MSNFQAAERRGQQAEWQSDDQKDEFQHAVNCYTDDAEREQ